MTPLRLGVALGTAFGESEWWGPDGSHVALSLTSQPLVSRFGLRVEAIVDRNTHGSRSAEPGVWHTGQDATMALTINTTYRLVGQQTGLYAIAGIGVYQRWSELRIRDFRSGDEVRRSSVAGLDANAGLGFDFRAFGRELFVESRLHGWAFGERAMLSLGVRF
jgi:hypothetical protein